MPSAIVGEQLWIEEPAGSIWHLGVDRSQDLRFRTACVLLIDARRTRIWLAKSRSEGPAPDDRFVACKATIE